VKILLLTKTDSCCREIQRIAKDSKEEVVIIEGERGQPLPNKKWKGDFIISFLSPWILPKKWLTRARVSINFHPGPPKYPGIGCYNFALYNKEKEYGVVCHHMLSKVDSGKIIKVIRFPINKVNSVYGLKNKTMKYLAKLFHEIWRCIISGAPLAQSQETWLKKPYSRRDLQALCRITKDMDEEEIKLRIKSTYFPGADDLPFIELFAYKFVFKK
jgi:methionyl-tRNA formyltransferase